MELLSDVTTSVVVINEFVMWGERSEVIRGLMLERTERFCVYLHNDMSLKGLLAVASA